MSPESNNLNGFRADVRAFLKAAVPADLREVVRNHGWITREQAAQWQRILHARGWGAPNWPREYGGTGWSVVEQAIFREELEACGAPRYDNLGVETIGPTILRHGTPAQCARFLPGILAFDTYWAQSYSEPEAGSDLASLRTTARREGDHWVVNGTKTWQSNGAWADWALVLVRTDPAAARKQDGISVLMLDLRSPGTTVRPIRLMNGQTYHAEFFFDNVKVPADQLLGQENRGWAIAKGLLAVERLFVARVAECKADVEYLSEAQRPDGRPLLDTPALVRRHAELQIRARALDGLWWPAIRQVQAGGQPLVDASLAKLQGNALFQDLQQLAVDAWGVETLPRGDATGRNADHAVHNLLAHYWRYRGITLGGGTTEVQRGIVAKAILAGESAIEAHHPDRQEETAAMLAGSLRRLLADRYSFEARREVLAHGSFDHGVWNSISELGLAGLLVSERLGGFGGSPIDLLPSMEALGEALVQEPVLWNSTLPAEILGHANRYPGSQELLQSVLAGQRQVGFAHREQAGPATEIKCSARPDGGLWRLDGGKRLVVGGDRAEAFIVSANTERGVALFMVPSDTDGLRIHRYELNDGRGAADLVLTALRLPDSALWIEPERAAATIDEVQGLATIAQCADSAGAMRKALAITVDYLRTRKQFGRPLADFQVLQHRTVELLRAWTSTRILLAEAAQDWQLASPAERNRRIHAAAWMTSVSARTVALDAIQLHGAIGLQDETPISHYAKRLIVNQLLAGDPDEHLDRFIAG